MFLRYGDLEFEMERIYRWNYRAVYDETGLDWLYNHVTIGVTCVFHGRATRSNKVTGAPTIGNDVGNDAVTSIRDLEAYMMQPRQRLQISVGTNVILESPLPHTIEDRNLYVDAKCGPQPISFQVTQMHGSGRTLICNFEIETWINSFYDEDKTPSILSHRWTHSHEIDTLNYTTRVVTGTVIFRKDFLEDHPTDTISYPDDYRSKFFHPIPDGTKRENIHVSQRADGTQVDYSFRDVEQPLSLGLNNPVLRIASRTSVGHEQFQFLGLPKRHYNVNVQCWGRRTSTRQNLINACVRMLANFGFGNNILGTGPRPYFGIEIDVDNVNKHASAVGRCFIPNPGALLFLAAMTNINGNIVQNYPESMPGIGTVALGPNPRPPNAAGTRGTYLERMVAQSLSDPATVPERPAVVTPTAVNKAIYGTGGY